MQQCQPSQTPRTRNCVSIDWNAGYVTDVNYTFGYYGELNPFRSRLPLLLSGRHAPRMVNACELGFGQGLSVSIHAAAQPGINWYGTDFNPSQAAFASELVDMSGSDAKLYDEAFGEFCNRPDLPDFDFIGLHGIWSWISDENRSVLVDFVRRKLRPGGVLYISYNASPGWSVAAPIRHLLKQHADIMGVSGQGVTNQAGAAMDFIEKFLAVEPAYAKVNPVVVEKFKQIRGQDRAYIAHEYMNRNWDPMYFADVERWLGDSKVSFGCPANTLEHPYELNMTKEQSDFLRAQPDVSLRETLRDFCVNQQFRRDYWLRGPRMLLGHEQIAALRSEQIILMATEANLPKTLRWAGREAGLVDAIYDPIYRALLDYKPHSIEALESAVAGKGVNFSQLTSALTILLGMGVVQGVAPTKDRAKAKAQTLALNKAIAQRSLSVGDIAHFASPITGGGISAPRFQQLFWLAKQNGAKTPDDWAAFAWRQLSALNQAILKDGAALEGEANLAELKTQATEWGERSLPIWNALGV